MESPGPVVFFGTPQFAVPSLEKLAASEFRPTLVVSQPSRPVGRGRGLQAPPVATRAEELGLDCEQVARVREDSFLERLKALEPWVGVVVAFGQIFPPRLLEMPTASCVNVHASLLPRYRGAAPIQAAIAAGDAITGVTTMRMAEELDSGPILLERELPIGATETSVELSERLAEAGGDLLLETLGGLASGSLEAHLQDESEVTWAPRLNKSDGAVDWSLPAHVIFNQHRAYVPWPGSTTWFRGKPVKIVSCGLVEGDPEKFSEESGTVVTRSPNFRVVCGDGRALELAALQKPGRRELSGTEFANGERVEVGDLFTSPGPS